MAYKTKPPAGLEQFQVAHPDLVIKHDLDLGPCVELPLSAITHDYGGYKVFEPPVVLQCPEHYEVLPHKFDIVEGWFRIAICSRTLTERKKP